MQLQINDQNYVTGYCIIGSFPDGIEVPETIFEGITMEKLPYYKYIAETKSLEFDEELFNEKEKEFAEQMNQDKYNPSKLNSLYALADTIIKSDSEFVKDSEVKLNISGLYEHWKLGKYEIGDIRTYNGQVMECYQAHDNSIYPDINPDNPSTWFTFWRYLHGKSKETARPYVLSQSGAEGIYHVGEYCIFNNKIYKCIQETVYNPEEYTQGWEYVSDLILNDTSN